MVLISGKRIVAVGIADEIPGPRLFVSGAFIQRAPYSTWETEYRWGVDGPEDVGRKVQHLLDAGVDNVEHMGLGIAPGYPQDVPDALAERNTSLYRTPTISLLYVMRYTGEVFPERLDDPAWRGGMPPGHGREVQGSGAGDRLVAGDPVAAVLAGAAGFRSLSSHPGGPAAITGNWTGCL